MTRRFPSSIRSPLALAALVAASSAACGNGAGASSADDDGRATFLLGTRVWDDTSTTSYFHTVPSLDEGTSSDPADALEIAGAAKLFAAADAGWFALGDGESPVITRYTFEGGSLVRGASISLLNYGVGSLWDTLYVVSPSKVYYPDRDNRRLIVIDPTAMTVEGTVELPDTLRAGYLSLYGYQGWLEADRLVFSVGWFDWDGDRILPEAGLVVVDTKTDRVARFSVDDRCGGITTSVRTDSGDTYFVSSALAGAAHRLGRLSTAPCALRVRAGETEFDPEYVAPLAELAGAITGEPVPAGSREILLRVLDEDLATVAEDSASWELTGQTAWRWLRWRVEDAAVSAVEDLAPSTADVHWFEVDGRTFGTETAADYSETTLIELTAEGGPRRALTAPGFLHGVARIR